MKTENPLLEKQKDKYWQAKQFVRMGGEQKRQDSMRQKNRKENKKTKNTKIATRKGWQNG
jgi:hypothetical protein